MQTGREKHAVSKARKDIIKAKPYLQPKPRSSIDLDSLPVQATISPARPVSSFNPENDNFPDYSEEGQKRKPWYVKISSIPKFWNTRERRTLSQQRPSYPCCPHTYHEAYCGEHRYRASPEQMAAMMPLRKYEPCPVHTSKEHAPGNWQCCLCKSGKNHGWSTVCGTCGHERGSDGCECPGADTTVTRKRLMMRRHSSQSDFTDRTEPLPSRVAGEGTQVRAVPNVANRRNSWDVESPQEVVSDTNAESAPNVASKRVTWHVGSKHSPVQGAACGREKPAMPHLAYRKSSWEGEGESLPTKTAADDAEVKPAPYKAYRRVSSWEVDSRSAPSQEAASETEMNVVPIVPRRKFSWE